LRWRRKQEKNTALLRSLAEKKVLRLQVIIIYRTPPSRLAAGTVFVYQNYRSFSGDIVMC
jgi:hypothetical protein